MIRKCLFLQQIEDEPIKSVENVNKFGLVNSRKKGGESTKKFELKKKIENL